jgi:hypothetical protein
MLQRLETSAKTLPTAYQVLLKVSSKDAITANIEYVTHRVIN